MRPARNRGASWMGMTWSTMICGSMLQDDAIVLALGRVDKQRGEDHDVSFTWSGGKGLVDKKEAILTFLHPDTGERSMVAVDLRANTLSVPDAVSDLFPETQFDDNGYGYVVEYGLNGGDPRRSFQSLAEAEVVTKWQHVLANQGRHQAPRIHTLGSELRELVGA